MSKQVTKQEERTQRDYIDKQEMYAFLSALPKYILRDIQSSLLEWDDAGMFESVSAMISTILQLRAIGEQETISIDEFDMSDV